MSTPRFIRFIAISLAFGAIGCASPIGDDAIVGASEGLRVDRECLSDRLAASDADPATRDRLVAERPDCFVRDGDTRRDQRRHCADIRLLAERVSADPVNLRRLANAYPECFAGDRDDPADECGRLRLAASEARDPAEARRLVGAYLECIDDRTRPSDEPDRCVELRQNAARAFEAGDRRAFRFFSDAYDRCIDSGIRPEPVEPTCGELRQAAEAAQASGDEARYRFYTSEYLACIEGDEPVDTDCGELRVAAARAQAAGERVLFERYSNAYLECIDGSDEMTISCDVVLCAEGHHCVESDRGPHCLPNECTRVRDERTGEVTVRCPDDGDACPRVLAPVCGADGVTYDNDCLARVAGATPVTDGPCARR